MPFSPKRLSEVRTSDGYRLGLGQRLFRRISGVNAADLLYEKYLEVENYDLGSTYFIPTDFIEDEESGPGVIMLSRTFDQVQENTWYRMPTFVARGEGEIESLPEK